MTRTGVARLILIGLGMLAIPTGVAGLRSVEAHLDPAGGAAIPATDTPGVGVLDSLVLAVVDHDPFRLTRSPAATAYSPVPVEPVYVEPPPPKPQLVLTGIMWGDEPIAIVEGVPGIDGARLLRPGDSVGGIRIRRITRQDVTLVGMDTTWVLQVRKPW